MKMLSSVSITTLIMIGLVMVQAYVTLTRIDRLERRSNVTQDRLNQIQKIVINNAELVHSSTRAIVGTMTILERGKLLKAEDAAALPEPYRSIFGTDIEPETNPNVIYMCNGRPCDTAPEED